MLFHRFNSANYPSLTHFINYSSLPTLAVSFINLLYKHAINNEDSRTKSLSKSICNYKKLIINPQNFFTLALCK